MKKHQHRELGFDGKQLLALLLSAILLLASLPVAAVAEDGLPYGEDGAPQIYDNTAEGANAAEADEGEVMEIESLREESVKHFYMGDGTYRAVSYGTEVHRKDAEGTWQEIDNTLTLQNGYHTTPDGRIKLASGSTANGYLLQLAENGYGIHMAMLPPSDPSGDMSMDMNANATLNTGSVTVNNAQRETVLETDSAEVQYQKLSKTLNHSKLTYANLSAGLDVSYELSGNKITEKIVVKGARDSYDFAFRLNLTGLTAALDESGSITFSDAETGEAVYRMNLPYVSLGDGGKQLPATYALQHVHGDDYVLLISADEAVNGLSAQAEAEAENSTTSTVNVNYVTITITSTPVLYEYETGEYAYISANDPTTGYTDQSMVSVGGGDIGYIYVPLPSDLEFYTVNSAYLSLFCEVEEHFDLRIYRCTQPWYNVSNLTYNYAQQNWNNFGFASDDYLDFAFSTKEVVSFDVTDFVRNWYYGVTTNHGFGLCGIDEEWNAWFYRDGDDSEPLLTVEYSRADITIPDGVYYLQNAMYGNFMQMSMQIGGIGSIADTGAFTGSTAQQWVFTATTDGFYTIKCVGTSLYLTAESNTIGAGVSVKVQMTEQNQEGTISHSQQWKISVQGDHIALSPRSSHSGTNSPTYDRCIGASPVLNSNNQRDVKVYSNLGAHSDDEGWMIYSANEINQSNSVTVEVHYDNSYVWKHGGEAAALARISDHINALWTKYYTEFSIVIKPIIMSEPTDCYACTYCPNIKNNENPHATCACESNDNCYNREAYEWFNGDDQTVAYHHTNIYNIFMHFAYNYSKSVKGDNVVRILFVGHDFCQGNFELNGRSRHNIYMGLGGLADKTSATILVCHRYDWVEINGLTEEATYTPPTTEGEFQSLLHEFGHIYYAPDHDGLNGHPSTDQTKEQNEDCIYGEHKKSQTVRENCTICTSCKNCICNNANRFNDPT